MNEEVVISSLMVLASPPTWTTKPSYNSVLQMDIKYLFEYTQKNKVVTKSHDTTLDLGGGRDCHKMYILGKK